MRIFFFFLDRFLGRKRVFLLSYFLVFFYQFQPLKLTLHCCVYVRHTPSLGPSQLKHGPHLQNLSAGVFFDLFLSLNSGLAECVKMVVRLFKGKSGVMEDCMEEEFLV